MTESSDDVILNVLSGAYFEIHCDAERGGAVGRLAICGPVQRPTAGALAQGWDEPYRPELASAHSLHEPLTGNISYNSDSLVAVTADGDDEIFAPSFFLFSFAELRRGITMNDLTPEYLTVAEVLFQQGVRDTRIWRAVYEDGIPLEYATEMFGGAS
jgi:hypothetical protein